MSTGEETWVVFCNAPDAAIAATIAEALIGARLAACVNIGAACESIYRWEGKVERAREVPLVIKTTASRYADVEGEIRRRHPYEVPEILALPVTQGLPAYLAWVGAETQL